MGLLIVGIVFVLAFYELSWIGGKLRELEELRELLAWNKAQQAEGLFHVAFIESAAQPGWWTVRFDYSNGGSTYFFASSLRAAWFKAEDWTRERWPHAWKVD